MSVYVYSRKVPKLKTPLKQEQWNLLQLRRKKLSGQLRKMALSLTPQAMYNQFKRP